MCVNCVFNLLQSPNYCLLREQHRDPRDATQNQLFFHAKIDFCAMNNWTGCAGRVRSKIEIDKSKLKLQIFFFKMLTVKLLVVMFQKSGHKRRCWCRAKKKWANSSDSRNLPLWLLLIFGLLAQNALNKAISADDSQRSSNWDAITISRGKKFK